MRDRRSGETGTIRLLDIFSAVDRIPKRSCWCSDSVSEGRIRTGGVGSSAGNKGRFQTGGDSNGSDQILKCGSARRQRGSIIESSVVTGRTYIRT